jgi:mitochondrial fission protein ELM1
VAQCIGVADSPQPARSRCRQFLAAPAFFLVAALRPVSDRREWEDPAGQSDRPTLSRISRVASGRRAAGLSAPDQNACRRGRTFTVFLKGSPRSGPDAADLVWVPEHDQAARPTTCPRHADLSLTSFPQRKARGAAGRKTCTADRSISSSASRRRARRRRQPSSQFFTEADQHRRFLNGLRETFWRRTENATLMITASRRTPPALAYVDLIKILVRKSGGHLLLGPAPAAESATGTTWQKSDAIVATADSTNMIGEAVSNRKTGPCVPPRRWSRQRSPGFWGVWNGYGACVHPFPGPR